MDNANKRLNYLFNLDLDVVKIIFQTVCKYYTPDMTRIMNSSRNVIRSNIKLVLFLLLAAFSVQGRNNFYTF